jgi:hypothetical protein
VILKSQVRVSVYKAKSGKECRSKWKTCDHDEEVIAAMINKTEFAECKINKPKPRTKTEFVKVEFNHAWEAVKEHEESKNIFHCNESGEYEICGYDMYVIGECVRDGELYRKVETEIDERQEFIDSAIELLNKNSHDNEANHYKEWFGSMFDSGKFKLVE